MTTNEKKSLVEQLEALREALDTAGRHLEDCCRTDIEWEEARASHNDAVDAVHRAERLVASSEGRGNREHLSSAQAASPPGPEASFEQYEVQTARIAQLSEQLVGRIGERDEAEEELHGLKEQLEVEREKKAALAKYLWDQHEEEAPAAYAAWVEFKPSSVLREESSPASAADQSPHGEESVNQGGASLSPGHAPPASSPAKGRE